MLYFAEISGAHAKRSWRTGAEKPKSKCSWRTIIISQLHLTLCLAQGKIARFDLRRRENMDSILGGQGNSVVPGFGHFLSGNPGIDKISSGNPRIFSLSALLFRESGNSSIRDLQYPGFGKNSSGNPGFVKNCSGNPGFGPLLSLPPVLLLLCCVVLLCCCCRCCRRVIRVIRKSFGVRIVRIVISTASIERHVSTTVSCKRSIDFATFPFASFPLHQNILPPFYLLRFVSFRCTLYESPPVSSLAT